MSKDLIVKNYTISSKHPIICVPIVATDISSIVEKINKARAAQVQMLELRLDYFAHNDNDCEVKKLLDAIGDLTEDIILLFTIRTAYEGGEFSGSIDRYFDLIRLGASHRAVDIVDVELDRVLGHEIVLQEIKSLGKILILSHHNFEKTYSDEEIATYYKRMAKMGADIEKIALMPVNKMDVARLMSASLDFSDNNPDCLLIGISMGELGKITRVSSSLFSSVVTFASIDEASAPGQIGFKEMKMILEALEK
ncbi:MAG: type I 3-dehydroquinate dehydratase [Pseudobutyrivibrio sp.]|nr:type I 3-dehydroquinate dehydratase [Pseudobutyrivibrio sp.]